MWEMDVFHGQVKVVRAARVEERRARRRWSSKHIVPCRSRCASFPLGKGFEVTFILT